jgi:hypothetical protein
LESGSLDEVLTAATAGVLVHPDLRVKMITPGFSVKIKKTTWLVVVDVSECVLGLHWLHWLNFRFFLFPFQISRAAFSFFNFITLSAHIDLYFVRTFLLFS